MPTVQQQEDNLGALTREVAAEKNYLKQLKTKLAGYDAADTDYAKHIGWCQGEIEKHEEILDRAKESLAEAAGLARPHGDLQQRRSPGRPRKSTAAE